MKKTLIGLSLAAVTLGGVAIANEHGGHKGMHMDPFGDKTVTRAEMQAHATEMFAKFDANKDGKLDEADRAAHKAEKFAALDTNKDGTLSSAEFAAGHGKGGHGDASGHRMGHHGGMGKGMMMLRHADANQDKAVTVAEFTAMHGQMFDKADTNKDGQLTQAERQAAHAKMRAEWKAKRAAGTAAADPHAGH